MSGNETFNSGRIDNTSHVPLYIQLSQILRQKIENGAYKPGQKLPTEKELVQQFAVSRITATAAIQELVKAGLVFRRQGKGSFVARPKIQDISSFSSFTTDVRQRGMRPSSKLIALEKTPAGQEEADRLGINPGETCLKIARVRLANDEPILVETAYLPYQLVPGLENEDLENGSLYECLIRRFGLIPTWSEGYFEASAATREQAALLGLKISEPVLWIHRITYDKNFAPLEWVHSMYRADRFSFSIGRQPVIT